MAKTWMLLQYMYVLHTYWNGADHYDVAEMNGKSVTDHK